MKVLLFDTTQAYLTPGGKQVHVQKLYENLPKVGVDVDYAKWWNPKQSFDIIHFFCYNSPYLLDSIQKKNKKTVLTQILDVQTNFSTTKKKIYGLGASFLKLLPGRVKDKFHTTSLNKYDALVYMHKYDRESAIKIFKVNETKTFIIPHASNPLDRIEGAGKIKNLPQKYLVSLGSIVERKRPLLLARMAKKAKIPIVFLGPGNESDEYFKEFKKLVDNKYIFYTGFVSQETKEQYLFHASGFVLLSTAESGCIAVYEAASLGLPLLLSNLLWAKAYTDPKEVYFCNCDNFNVSVDQLQEFFTKSEKKVYPSFKVHTWEEIALMYKEVYLSVIKS